MDKIAANNHIVSLKKEIKNAKAMVSGNLIRKLKELKDKKEKLEAEMDKQRITNKIERICSEMKLIQSLDTYPIAKEATLKPDKKIWTELLSNNKATPEERLTCRIILKNNVQKCVAKFRSDNKDCDEWIEEYYEFRDKKKQLEEALMKKVKKRREKVKKSKNAKKTSRSHDRNPKKDKLITNSSNQKMNTFAESNINQVTQAKTETSFKESLHPSWESKRKEKELLKAAFSGNTNQQPKRIILSADS